ncbi:ribonuclease domain-containing protein [Actinokineospora sp. NBRC 105648]|uniref:ribonuclease domain-containing protein n=1 Tax=Actinokineospora sp. NBRC 105648 TaxID=3032206 RepID=UPI0024A5A61E|nr:ribonuclease domain-containing protein [Actinokineospora sp. NBRC 105648]GLZ39634.1 ribonuclease N1 [Actinokineospora sp. NBRC 105648]
MGSRKRITAALVGLVLLVVAGWLAQRQAQRDSATPPTPSVSASATTPPSPATKSGTTTRPGGTTTARASATVPGTASGLAVSALSELPQQALVTWRLIERGGPFPYPRNDGVPFENRERLLPQQKSGYYREYTVPTPGSPDRGPRRLVTGAAHELFYTGDHYGSFVVVDTDR